MMYVGCIRVLPVYMYISILCSVCFRFMAHKLTQMYEQIFTATAVILIRGESKTAETFSSLFMNHFTPGSTNKVPNLVLNVRNPDQTYMVITHGGYPLTWNCYVKTWKFEFSKHPISSYFKVGSSQRGTKFSKKFMV